MALIAFQRSGFQNNAFQENSSPVDTHDGGHWSERDYKRYRRKIELIANAGSRFNESKYIKEANKIVQIVQEIPVSVPTIEKVALKEIRLNDQYFENIQKELALVLNYLNAAIDRKQILKIEADQEMEDEQILLSLL